MPVSRRSALALMTVLAACCPAVAADGWMKDLDAARAEAQRLDRPILVHFHAAWCPPCLRMEKKVLNTPAVLDQIKSSVVAVKINIDDHQDLARRFEIDKLPADIFLEPDGKRLIESTGERTTEEYTQSIARASTRYTDLVAQRLPKPAAPAANVASGESAPANARLASQEAMLLGYCPVTLLKNRKWEKGSPQFTAEFRGQTYWMCSAADQQVFQQNPARYAPQLLGCDPVLMARENRAIQGSTRFGAFYDDELFLFSSDANRKQFKSSPDRYIRDKVVLDVDQIETVIR
ncbi:MAG: thioredoxin family protein [Planctomyces sp.]|nr:thioredoxin family protein [Planctomyces sp.]